jgi:tetratricopeptide (TPR) repeat protein
MKSKRFHFIFLATIIIFSLMIYGCAKPPTKEIENAEKAITEAKSKEADLYVEDIFKKAEDSLKKAKELVAIKKYKEAKKAAEDAASFAQQAIPMVELNKTKKKTEAEQMVQDVQESINELKSMVSKIPKKKSPINREEIEGNIGKWEVDLVSIKEQLEAQKVRQAYDLIKTMSEEIKAQRDNLTNVLEQQKTAEKK